MRITFVCAGGFNLSGGDRVISIYAERLQRRGHQVFCITPLYPPPKLSEQLRSVLRGRGLIPRVKPGASHFDKSPVPHKRLNSFRPIVDSDLPDADVVIATWYLTGKWVHELSPSKGAKAFFLQHYEVFPYIPKKDVDDAWRLPLHKIAIARWLVNLARDEFGDHDVSLVPNSVDTEQFNAPPRDRFPTPTIGMLYNHAPWKGVPVCVAALDKVREEFPDLKVVTFGTTDVRPEAPLPSYVTHHIAPAQDKIKDIYSQCDVWLCGSTSEGFNLPALEAMACRCPVVSTAAGGPIDFIKDGVNGYLVPVNDVDALADRMKRVLRLQNEEWKKLSDGAHHTATSYSWDDATDLFEAALQRAIERTALGQLGPTTRIGKLLALVGR